MDLKIMKRRITSEIKEILHSKERAFSIAKHVNGQVFEIKCVPVKEDINDTSQDK